MRIYVTLSYLVGLLSGKAQRELLRGRGDAGDLGLLDVDFVFFSFDPYKLRS